MFQFSKLFSKFKNVNVNFGSKIYRNLLTDRICQFGIFRTIFVPKRLNFSRQLQGDSKNQFIVIEIIY